MTMKVVLKNYCTLLIMTFVCNHHRNIQTLLIEIFKIKKGFAPPIMESILKGRNNTYVRNVQEFETEGKITVYFGLETISYRFPQLWSLLLFVRPVVRQWVCNSYLSMHIV